MNPKHLEKIYHPTDNECLEGNIICECGCKTFGIMLFGEVLGKQIGIEEYQEKYAQTVKAKCNRCGKEYLLYDFARHGYDGLLCEDGVIVPDEMLKPLTIGEDDSFEIQMQIEVDDEEQFLEEVVNYPPLNNRFSLDDRMSIWSWVVINLTGAKSGRKYSGWVDEELA